MELFWILTIIAIPLFGLVLSNVALDRGLAFPLARKIGHLVGGVPYLISPWLFNSPWPVIFVSAGFTILLIMAHILKKDLFRGVGGSSRPGSIAEVTYPLAGTISLLVGWAWLENSWLGVVPILYMSWGDGVAGIVRYAVYKGKPMSKGTIKSGGGSFVFLFVCIFIALLYWQGSGQRYLAALAGAAVASFAEMLCSQEGVIKVDDNLPIVLSALMTMMLIDV